MCLLRTSSAAARPTCRQPQGHRRQVRQRKAAFPKTNSRAPWHLRFFSKSARRGACSIGRGRGEEGHLIADESVAKLGLALPLHRELGCSQELGLQRGELRGLGLAEARERSLSSHGLRAVAARLQGRADVADELLHGLCGGGGDALALDMGPGPQGNTIESGLSSRGTSLEA